MMTDSAIIQTAANVLEDDLRRAWMGRLCWQYRIKCVDGRIFTFHASERCSWIEVSFGEGYEPHNKIDLLNYGKTDTSIVMAAYVMSALCNRDPNYQDGATL